MSSEMKNPRSKDYAKGVFISAVIILFTIVVSSLAIAVVVPESDLNLATGVMQAFLFFLSHSMLPGAINLVALVVILGGYKWCLCMDHWSFPRGSWWPVRVGAYQDF
jgi:amino acid transporter